MPRGFFHGSQTIRKPTMATVARCGACGIYKECQSPKMPVSGEGRRGILIVGEAPGKTEDEQGTQFVGKSGELLIQTLRQLGVKRDDCWFTNALICRPPSNRTPDKKEIGYCRPNLVKTIKDLNPTVIVPLGGVAVESLIGWLWREDTGGISRWVGWQIPSQRLNAWICPTYHPSFVLRTEQEKTGRVVRRYFEDQLEAAVEKTERPHTEISRAFGPICNDARVQKIFSHEDAATLIRRFIEAGEMVAFDYECDRLKPDHRNFRIISCSISDGKQTIAFPWHGEAIKAMREFADSDVPKIASNLKYEDRCTRRVFGVGVRNWFWDTMLAAHWLDNRTGITGLKFQAFVLLGEDSYDDHISQFLKGENSNTPNQAIQEIEIGQLLTYNGLDSLLEYQVALKQMEMIECRK